MQTKILAITFFLLVAIVASAQDSKDPWERVKQVQEGQRLKVVDMKWKAWTGEFVGATDDAITIRTYKGEVAVARGNVLRVTDLGWSKRGRNALIGFAIGTAAGAVHLRNAYDFTAFGKVLIMTGMYGMPGAAIGALVPSHPTLYRAKVQPGDSK